MLPYAMRKHRVYQENNSTHSNFEDAEHLSSYTPNQLADLHLHHKSLSKLWVEV